jgi:hypothetical protein
MQALPALPAIETGSKGEPSTIKKPACCYLRCHVIASFVCRLHVSLTALAASLAGGWP